MTNEVVRIIAQALAEQQYMNHLLARKLVEKGILEQGELQRLYEQSAAEKEEFFHDFLRYLASIGLETD